MPDILPGMWWIVNEYMCEKTYSLDSYAHSLDRQLSGQNLNYIILWDFESWALHLHSWGLFTLILHSDFQTHGQACALQGSVIHSPFYSRWPQPPTTTA